MHGARLMLALRELRFEHWPYRGPVGIREGDAMHVVDSWCYLGTASSDEELHAILEAGRPSFELDAYRILVKAMRRAKLVDLHELAAARAGADPDAA